MVALMTSEVSNDDVFNHRNWISVRFIRIVGKLTPSALSIILIATMIGLASVLTIAAQDTSVELPGDPTSPEDLIFVDINASKHVSCGVTAAENMRCWGHLSFGPALAEGFVDVATGVTYTCGLKPDGTVQCFGNEFIGGGQLTPPVQEDGQPHRFSAIYGRTDHLCGIRVEDRRLVCWGSDSRGQVSGQKPGSSNLMYDFSQDEFADVFAADRHTCGILDSGPSAGQIRCWGYDYRGTSTVPDDYSSTIFKAVEGGSDLHVV